MQGKVIFNKALNKKYYLMEIESEEFVKDARPGQFMMVKPQQYDYLFEPLLRRPFGICDIIGSRFQILYVLIGKGTNLLSNIKSDTKIQFSSPVGNYFKVQGEKKVVLAGGGVGIAPMLYWSKILKNSGISVDIFYGGKTSEDILLIEEFNKYCDKVFITTEDGSIGYKGLISDIYSEHVKNYEKAYACGPKKMLEVLTKISVAGGVRIDVSLDERMACGMGACLGCLIYTKNHKGEVEQKRCCVEGPIFNGADIIW